MTFYLKSAWIIVRNQPNLTRRLLTLSIGALALIAAVRGRAR
jgi:hypothetical protein